MNTTHAANAEVNVTPAAMQEAPAGRFEALVQDLHAAAAMVDAQATGADAALRRLMAQLRADTDPRCTGLFVFASALAQRLSGTSSREANLYLRRFEVPQIQLFNLLGQHVPMAGMATRIANDAMALAIAGQQHPTLIDVGMGTGRQFAMLLNDLAAAGTLPERLTVIGIEPSETALAEARSLLGAAALRLGVRLQFHGITASVEALSDADWQAVAAACSTRPVINASFALHHIADDAQGCEQRNAVLRRLHALQPVCFVLSEPDVDHFEPRFLQRFKNCYAHFGAVFGVLDALPLAQAERDALKVGFFGREIADILATPEPLRSERHEPSASWLQRLTASGFAMQATRAAMPVSGHAGVVAVPRSQRVGIEAGNDPVVAVFVAAA